MTAALDTHAQPSRLSPAELRQITALVFELTGIALKAHKQNMVAGRMKKLLRDIGQPDVESFVERVNHPDGASERAALISAYTTNMTRFDREGRHFQHLTRHILPRLTAEARSGARVRIWSAGCSSGEEAYQMAFLLLDVCPEAAQLDIKILASDIDGNVLQDAKAGLYQRAHVAALPSSQVEKYFYATHPASDRLRVKSKVHDILSFRQLNLHDPWPFQGKFDVIMCRNVAIYFDEVLRAQLWDRFAAQLTARGVLYIGHAETLDLEASPDFRRVADSSVFAVTAPIKPPNLEEGAEY